MIACLLVLCGSSVYDQKNWSPSYLAATFLGRIGGEDACIVVVTNVAGIVSPKKQLGGRLN